jgi:F-type H+-transporting ATPase subunit alpha
LKLDQAQFRELEAFTKFGSDLDAVTECNWKGRRNVEILKQGLNPYREDQVAIIYAVKKSFKKRSWIKWKNLRKISWNS